MKTLATQLAISIGTLAVFYFLFPVGWLDNVQNFFSTPHFGSTITTINGSDTISSSRTTINTNFSNLNTDKLQSGDTAAALTITSGTIGTLTLTNPLTVPNGGTASTTLSSNQVLLGAGTAKVKTPDGWGVSGQFLTSGGLGNPPTWTTSSLDQTASYNFTGSFFYVKNLFASSTVANPLTLNTVAYSFPSSQGAATTFLKNDGTGALTWSAAPGSTKLYSTGTNPSTSQTASTTILSISIAAGTLSTTNAIQCDFYGDVMNVQSTATLWLDVSYGGTASTTMTLTQSSGGALSSGGFHLLLVANGATNAQSLVFGTDLFNAASHYSNGTFTTDSTAIKTLFLVAKASGASTFFSPDLTVCSTIK